MCSLGEEPEGGYGFSHNGKRRRIYRQWATPLELLQAVPHWEACLRPGTTAGGLKQFADPQTDTEAALALQAAKRKLLARVTKLSA